MMNETEGERRSNLIRTDGSMACISKIMSESLHDRKLVAFRMYDPHEELTVRGVVDQFDTLNQRFMVDGEWFRVGDIKETALEDGEQAIR